MGYLQADLEVSVYAYLPWHHEYRVLPMEVLAVLREQLLKLVQNEGPTGLKFMAEHRRSTGKTLSTFLNY